MSAAKTKKRKSVKNVTPKLPLSVLFGWGCVLIAITLLVLQFMPILALELQYTLNSNRPSKEGQSEALQDTETPKDPQFGILIPKIHANASVIPQVDPYDSHIYQQALTKGVAHAKGTALPGQNGNMFIFSHSSVNFWEAAKYNSVFYLLSKLEPKDDIIIYFKTIPYRYKVSDSRVVESNALSYLASAGFDQTLTLMTCWPPGTNLKRFVVTAKLIYD